MAGRLGYPALKVRSIGAARRPVAVSADRGQHLVAQQAQPLGTPGPPSRCPRLHGLSLGIFGNGVRRGDPMTETERCGMWCAERSVLRRGGGESEHAKLHLARAGRGPQPGSTARIVLGSVS